MSNNLPDIHHFSLAALMYPFPHLAPILARALFADLRRGLPQPHDASDAARDERDMIAMAAVHALDARDAAEAMLAIRVVAQEAHARAALEEAAGHRDDPARADRARAQAALMGREAQRALRSLQSLQATRPTAPAPALPERVGVPSAPPADHRAAPPADHRVKPAPYGMDRPLPVCNPRDLRAFRSLQEIVSRQSYSWDTHEAFLPAICKSNIKMTPLSKIEVTLPQVSGVLEWSDVGGVDERSGGRSAASIV